MVFPLTRLDLMGYDNMPDYTWVDYYYAQAFPEESFLRRGGNAPFYHGPLLQRRYGLRSNFKSVAKTAMSSLKGTGKFALTIGLEVLQDVAKGKSVKTMARK